MRYENEASQLNFALKLAELINPKIEEEDAKKAIQEAIEFAKTCELTASEMLEAYKLCMAGKLYTAPDVKGNSEKVNFFREMHQSYYFQVKEAYIYYKTTNMAYQEAGKVIKEAQKPIAPAKTEEQLKSDFLELIRLDYVKMKAGMDSECINQYFRELVKSKLTSVRIDYVASLLEAYRPPQKNIQITFERQKNRTPAFYFKENLVMAYFEKYGLMRLNEEEFVNHWKEVYEHERT